MGLVGALVGKGVGGGTVGGDFLGVACFHEVDQF